MRLLHNYFVNVINFKVCYSIDEVCNDEDIELRFNKLDYDRKFEVTYIDLSHYSFDAIMHFIFHKLEYDI